MRFCGRQLSYIWLLELHDDLCSSLTWKQTAIHICKLKESSTKTPSVNAVELWRLSGHSQSFRKHRRLNCRICCRSLSKMRWDVEWGGCESPQRACTDTWVTRAPINTFCSGWIISTRSAQASVTKYSFFNNDKLKKN